MYSETIGESKRGKAGESGGTRAKPTDKILGGRNMGRRNRKAVGLALAVLLIALSCACRYSLVSFQSLEEGVAYYQRGAEIERVIEGDDTILVAYKFLGGHGFIVFLK